MTGSSTYKPAPNSAPKSIATPRSYNAEFPALPPSSQRLQLVRPVCLSPTKIRSRVGGMITCTGIPPINLVDRAKWMDAYNAYLRDNVKFDMDGKLGEYPPLMNYPSVHH